MKHCVWLALAIACAGCPDRGISELGNVPTSVATKDVPITADLDILFVIDNSSSTQDKQTAFAQNFGNFVTALKAFPSGQPNLHIGVVTTSIDVGVNVGDVSCHPSSGQDGLLQNRTGHGGNTCGQPTTARFLSDLAIPGNTTDRDINYTGDLSSALACIADVGTQGCGFESPLEAIRRALDGRHAENDGFLRKGAFLAVVILTDEDDCSAGPTVFRQTAASVGDNDLRCSTTAYDCDHAINVSAPGSYAGCKVRHNGFLNNPSDYVDFLRGLKADDGVAVAVIAGDPKPELSFGPLTLGISSFPLALEPSCTTTIGGKSQIARPALRLAEFADGFSKLGLFRTICQPDYSGALTDIGALLFQAVSPCLDGEIDPRDARPDIPGLQPDCTITELAPGDGTDAEPIGTVVPACAMLDENTPDPNGARPCWRFVQHAPACAATETGLELHIERSTEPPPNTKVRASCSIVTPAEGT